MARRLEFTSCNICGCMFETRKEFRTHLCADYTPRLPRPRTSELRFPKPSRANDLNSESLRNVSRNTRSSPYARPMLSTYNELQDYIARGSAEEDRVERLFTAPVLSNFLSRSTLSSSPVARSTPHSEQSGNRCTCSTLHRLLAELDEGMALVLVRKKGSDVNASQNGDQFAFKTSLTQVNQNMERLQLYNISGTGVNAGASGSSSSSSSTGPTICSKHGHQSSLKSCLKRVNQSMERLQLHNSEDGVNAESSGSTSSSASTRPTLGSEHDGQYSPEFNIHGLMTRVNQEMEHLQLRDIGAGVDADDGVDDRVDVKDENVTSK